jgi:hypothetical protein
LLTEAEVQRSFQGLFRGGEITEGALEKAEELLEELRPESPLRHRLDIELEELRRRLIAAN